MSINCLVEVEFQQPTKFDHFRILLFLLLQATCQLFLFYFVLEDPIGLQVGVVNDELLNCSDVAFSRSLSDSRTCLVSKASCLFLEEIPGEVIDIKFYSSFDDAYLRLKKGEIQALVHIKENFTDIFNEYLQSPSDEYVFSKALEITDVHIDFTLKTMAYTIQGELYQTMTHFLRRLLTVCGVSENLLKPPLAFKTPIYGQLSYSYRMDIAHTVITL